MLAAVLFLPLETAAVSAEKAILLDAVSGRVLYEKNADERSLIASTTKIMTALVICEQCNVLDRMRIPKEAVGIEGSSMYLKEGEILTLQELIYCGGTVEGFAELMNDKARILGLTGSHFENPHGLDTPGHYATARDLAVLADYAMDNPIFYKTVSAKTVTLGERVLRNHNKLLWQVEGADGVKTGYTKAAGRILVSSATRNGRRLIAVTINDGNDWQDHARLLETGFSDYETRLLLKEGDCVGSVAVMGAGGSVQLLAKADFSYAVAPGEKVEICVPGPGFVYAPVVQGADAGYAHVTINGNPVGRMELVYGETVELPVEKDVSLWDRLFGGKAHERAASENTIRQGRLLQTESGGTDPKR